MSPDPDDPGGDSQAVIAALRAELAARNSDYAERIGQQAATIEVLRAMSASPGDAQPVFEMIAVRARDLCGAYGVTVYEYDGALIHWRANTGLSDDPAVVERIRARFPAPATPGTVFGRAILNRDVVHIRDIRDDLLYDHAMRGGVAQSTVAVPMLRDGVVIGALGMGSRELGGFSDSQVALLQTFAEQAVIAITSAETFRALAERNAAYAEQIDHQAATIDVLKAMSASPGDPQPVFDLIATRAWTICSGAAVALFEYDGTLVHFRAYRRDGVGSVADMATGTAEQRAYAALWPRVPTRDSSPCVAILEARTIHVRDVRTEPGLHPLMQKQSARSVASIPLLRDGTVLGAITLAATDPGGFSDTQLALLQTFAEQAVIAITSAGTFRALEARTAELAIQVAHQEATIDVLKVMSSSTSDTQPVFDIILSRAIALSGAKTGAIFGLEAGLLHPWAMLGFDPEAAAAFRKNFPLALSERGVMSRAVLRRQTLYARDYHAENPDVPQYTRDLGYNSLVAVPLLREGTAIGVLTVQHTAAEAFSAEHIALLETFAEQAVIAIGSVATFRALQERTSELQQSLEYQAATIDVLKVMSTLTGDPQPVFETILSQAMTLCGCMFGGLYEFDGRLLHLRATSGFDVETTAGYWRQFPMPPSRATGPGRAILDRRLEHVRDIQAEPEATAAALALGHRSHVNLPLSRGDTVIGLISVGHKEVDAFTPAHIELLKTFAEQAVIAIGAAANYRALETRTAELTRSVGELQALAETMREVNASLDRETVLATIIARAVALGEAAEGTIYEYDASEDVFLPRASAGMEDVRIAALRAPVAVADVQGDPTVPEAATILAGIHAVLAVPLLREERVVGGLVIRRRSEGEFAASTVTLMQTFAAQAVLAIENARLFDEVQARTRELTQLLADLRAAQDRLVQTEKLASLGQLTAGIAHEIKNPLNFINNFSALSVELIDELEGVLAPEPIGAAARDEVDELTGMLKNNLEKVVSHGKRADGIVRNMLLHSRESGGERRAVDFNATVEEALNLAYHGARAEKPGFNVTLVRDYDPAAGSIELYPQEFTRVLLNLISNGFYAGARRKAESGEADFEPTLAVSTEARPDAVVVRVRDNGTGIPAAVREKMFEPFFTTKPAGEGTGLGLSLSHDIVVKQHGGTIAVDSEVGVFTEFSVSIPRSIAGAAR